MIFTERFRLEKKEAKKLLEKKNRTPKESDKNSFDKANSESSEDSDIEKKRSGKPAFNDKQST